MKLDGQYVRSDFVSCLSDTWRTVSLSDGSVLRINTKLLRCYSAWLRKHYERTEITVNVSTVGTSLAKRKEKLMFISKLGVHVCLHCKTSLYCGFDKSYNRTRCDRCGRSA